MNMQAMMKQAQKLQKDMLNAQKQIEEMTFEGKSSFVTVTMTGKREITNVKIDSESLDKDDIEMVQDLVMVAVNDALRQLDKVTEEKMGAYTKGMPGLF